MVSASLRRSFCLATLAASGMWAGAAALPGQGECSVSYGSDYRARFDADSVEFTPAMSDARSLHSWRFRLTAVERGTPAFATRLPPPTKWLSTRRVSYARPGFVERYDVRRDGLEQSFVFDALPPGTGDLVVRGRVTTGLVADAPGVPAQTLHFGTRDGSGVRLGAVTGIDASGATAGGLMRYTDGELELVLPAAFVDQAKLPLVLDPLIGTMRSPSAAWAGDSGPDVAYDETTDVFLVVFARDNPAFPRKVYGLLLRPDGTVVGEPFEIGDGEQPKVGNVSACDSFLVAYARAGGLYVRSVHAATRAISAETTVVDNNLWRVHDVGDSSSEQDDQVPLLFGVESVCSFYSRGVEVQVTSSGRPQLGASFWSQGHSEVVVKANATEVSSMPGHYLVAYDEWSSYFGTPRQVWVDLVDPSGRRVHTITTGWPLGSDASIPAIAGEGAEYVLVYEGGDSSSVRLVCRHLSVASGSIALGAQIEVVPAIVRSPTWRNELTGDLAPSIARQGGSYLLGFKRHGRSFVTSLDPSECTPCEEESALSLGLGEGLEVVVVGRTRNGRAADEAMLAWGRSGTQKWIETSAFRAEDGIVTDLGGGCAPGGLALVSCARAGNANFTHELRSAAAQAQALLVLGVGSASFPCGPCTLVPDLALPVVVAFSGTTDAGGNASAVTALPGVPSLVGAVLVEQWVVVTGGGCSLLGLALSNGLAVVIQ